MTSSTALDRRAALKAKHRGAILTAARQLIAERGGPRFRVDELAERADVARRTVFNHFASVDDVVLALCDEALDVLIDDFVRAIAAIPVGSGTSVSMFDELAESLRSADLPTAITSIVLILGGPESDDPRGRALETEAFRRVGGRLVQEVRRRHPTAEALDAELLVGALMSGISVITAHWVREGGDHRASADRAEWDRLLDRVLGTLRDGYAATS